MAVNQLCEQDFDVPGDPYPTSGDVTIQGEVHPFSRPLNTNPNEFVKEEDLEDDDFIILNRSLVFTDVADKPIMSRRKYVTGGKRRREGNVPRIMANWYHRALDITNNRPLNVRLVGTSYEGIPNGADARKFPVQTGRCAIQIAGATSALMDPRFITDPVFGDYLEWLPFDSGARPMDTHHYGTCIVRNVPPERAFAVRGLGGQGMLGPLPGGQGYFGGHHATAPDMERTLLTYNVLSYVAQDPRPAQTAGRPVPDDDTRFADIRTAVAAWEYKKLGLAPKMVGGNIANANTMGLRWTRAGFGDATRLNGNNSIASLWNLSDAFLQTRDGRSHKIFVTINGQLRLNPLPRLPLSNTSHADFVDAVAYGSPDAPGIVAHVARVLSSPLEEFIVPQDTELVLRYIDVWNGATPPIASAGDNTVVTGVIKAVSDLIDALPNLQVNFTAIGDATRINNFGIRGNDATNVDVLYEIPITRLNGTLANAITALEGLQYAGQTPFQGRFSYGAPYDSVKGYYEDFCRFCDGNLFRSATDAGKMIYGNEWDALSDPEKQFLEDNQLRKFEGFMPALVMSTIQQALAGKAYWIEHPLLREQYDIGTIVNARNTQLVGPTTEVIDVSYEAYFGVAYHTQYGVAMWRNIDGGDVLTPATATRASFDIPATTHETIKEGHETLVKTSSALVPVPTGIGMGHIFQSHDNMFTPTANIADVRTQVDRIPVDPRRIFGVFLERQEEDFEVRFLLRPHMPLS